jgi:hypothetical protein
MKAIRSLFSRPEQPAIPGVHLYFSDDSLIVAPIHQNLDGIYYEQEMPLVISGRPTPERLGAAFQRGLESFSIQARDLKDEKRSDWPAFRMSGARTLKEFENLFRPMHCYALNSSNAVVRASIRHPAQEDIELSISFNPLLGPEAIGEKLLQLARVARAT